VLIESIFGLPGIGTLLVNAIYSRDYVLIQGVVLVVTVAFVLINTLVDLLYVVLDPRLRS
jgi:peptide/nickel transport system permease protein